MHLTREKVNLCCRPRSSNSDVTFLSSRLCRARREQTRRLIEEHFFLFSLGLLQKHLGCCFPLRLCPVLCLLTCVVHSCSPLSLSLSLIMRCLSYLKKARRHLTWGIWCVIFSLFSIVGVSVRGKPNEPTVLPSPSAFALFYVLWYIPTNWKTNHQLLSLCHCFWAKSTHSPLRSRWFNKKNVFVWICRKRSHRVCGVTKSGGKRGAPVQKQVSLLCFYLSKTPAVHLLPESDLTINSPSFFGFSFFSWVACWSQIGFFRCV